MSGFPKETRKVPPAKEKTDASAPHPFLSSATTDSQQMYPSFYIMKSIIGWRAATDTPVFPPLRSLRLTTAGPPPQQTEATVAGLGGSVVRTVGT